MEVLVLALVPVLAVLAAVSWVVWQVFKGLRWLLVRLFRALGLVLARVARFAKNEVVEVVQLVGALLTGAVLLPLTAVNFVIGRWRTGRHYGRAVEDEFVSALLGIYRIAFGHPLRLVGLGRVLEGIERRLPDVVDRAPRRVRKGDGAADFPGYDVVGTLPAGGSGAQLYLARPRPDTFERFRREGRELPAEVVVKSFALEQGSTLPMIVRESRALEAANRLGLVYEHHLGDDRFFYVMRYVHGDELDAVVGRLHARSNPEGLNDRDLALVLGYAQDLVRTLGRFHTGGLWHKDVKPANLIVSGDRAHLVDFGLVTPLASALTLTTHGTEYYRDPEMVRLAMQGVKVHEVDGVKFDLYSAGAVLYSMLENSFPAHGSLSRITKRCPEALAWIVRRAMADIGTRYGDAAQMLGDLAAVARAEDPFALRPADLPSFHADPAQSPFANGANGASGAAAFDEGPLDPVEVGSDRGAERSRPVFLLAEQRRERGPASRRRRRRLMAAAALFFFAFFFVAVRGATEHTHARSARSIARTVHAPRLYEAEQRAYDEARAILDEVAFDDEMDGLAERWLRRLRPLLPDTGARAERPVHARGAADAAVSGGRVLVLEDPTSSVETETVLAVEHALAKNGFEVVGGLGQAGTTDVRLIAGARHAIGLGNPSDGDAVLRLQGFLDEEAELDAILWLAHSDEDDAALYRVLVRSELSVGPPLRFEGPSVRRASGAVARK